MASFEASVFIDAPVERVWAFHERDDVLQLLAPSNVKVLRREGGLKTGAEVEFLIPVGPLGIRWLARHTAYEQYRLFQDVQVSGPFRSWVHNHRFVPEGRGTRLIDQVEFTLPLHPLSVVAHWAVRLQLGAMFRHRHEVTRRYCED
ncbi:MAG: SRPBCC family protein [Bryobacterales bacterium]|nr:SRPBCC family protein [Bryobacterales bacterium]